MCEQYSILTTGGAISGGSRNPGILTLKRPVMDNPAPHPLTSLVGFSRLIFAPCWTLKLPLRPLLERELDRAGGRVKDSAAPSFPRVPLAKRRLGPVIHRDPNSAIGADPALDT